MNVRFTLSFLGILFISAWGLANGKDRGAASHALRKEIFALKQEANRSDMTIGKYSGYDYAISKRMPLHHGDISASIPELTVRENDMAWSDKKLDAGNIHMGSPQASTSCGDTVYTAVMSGWSGASPSPEYGRPANCINNNGVTSTGDYEGFPGHGFYTMYDSPEKPHDWSRTLSGLNPAKTYRIKVTFWSTGNGPSDFRHGRFNNYNLGGITGSFTADLFNQGGNREMYVKNVTGKNFLSFSGTIIADNWQNCDQASNFYCGIEVEEMVIRTNAAPSVATNSVTNTCPKLTSDISSIASGCAAGTTLEWHMTNTGLSNATKVADITNVGNGTYYAVCHDLNKNCYSDPSTGVVVLNKSCNELNPDMNATLVGVPVSGDMSDNDKLVPGSNFGTAVPDPSNPTTDKPVMNPDGSYTFVTDTPGEYVFDVPVCAPAQTTNCPTEALVITVNDPKITNNPPSANDDIVRVDSGTIIKIDVKDNDQPGNPGGSLGKPIVIEQPEHGTIRVNPDGTITYVPDPGFTGKDSMVYSICDTTLHPPKCDEAVIHITVDPSNAPNTIVANDDYLNISSSKVGTGNVMKNDIDPDGDVMSTTPQHVTVPGKGTFNLDNKGNYTFTPDPSFSGPVNFPYTVCDDKDHCTEATLYIVVTGGNVLNPDMNATLVDVPVSGDMSDNDKLVPGSNFGTPVPDPSNPTTDKPVMNPDGSYTFVTDTPGEYVFDVPVCAPAQTTNCPTESLVITVNDPYAAGNPPSVNDDIVRVDSGSTVTIDPKDNDQPGNPGGSLGTPTITDQPDHGTVTVNPDGTITYVPNPGFTGKDSIVYSVCDTTLHPPKCDDAVIRITVDPKDAPNTIVANDDYANIASGTKATGNVMSNDIDPDGDVMSTTPQNVTVPGKGIFVLDNKGNYTFTPDPSFSGPVNFPYRVCDGNNHCDTATLYVVVTPGNELNPDMNATLVDVPVSGDMSDNDKLVPGSNFGTPVPDPSNPSTDKPVMNPDGSYTFVTDTPGEYVFDVPVCAPAQTTNCPTESLVITVNDPYAAGNPPSVNDDIVRVDSGSTVTIDPKDNDQPGNPGGSLGTPTITDQPDHGTVTVNPDGTITYVPNPGFTGKDSIVYSVCDTTLHPPKCDDAVIRITVDPKDAPNTIVANDDYANIASGTKATGNVMSNDIDPDGDVMSTTPQNVTVPGKGTFVLDNKGNYTFTPDPSFSGPVNFPYRVCDGNNHCDTATLYVVVTPGNELNPDMNATLVDVPVSGDMSDNDKLVPGSNFGTPVPDPSNPTTDKPVMNPDGSYTFVTDTPGEYVFDVPVCAPAQTTNCPTESLVITVNDPYAAGNPPSVNDDIVRVDSGSTVTIDPKDNDQPGNPGGSLGTPTITDQPDHGTVTVNPDGTITYVPNPGFTGKDSIVYSVCDTTLHPPKCDDAVIRITVDPKDAPNTIVANDDYANIASGTKATGNVMSNDIDPDGDVMSTTPQNVTVPGKGTFVLDNKGNYTFTPDPSFSGPVNFPYRVCDGNNHCDTATLYVVVVPGNKLNPDFNVTDVNVPVSGNMSTNDKLPGGGSFGAPAPNPSNPSPAMPIVNPDGTYTFVTSVPGVYEFNVPVCAAGQTTDCPTELLTITVTRPDVVDAPPVANTDIAETKDGDPVTIDVTANDKPGSPNGSLGTPTIVDSPNHGTVIVNPDGTVTYKPNPGFVGVDTITYSVCDTALVVDLCSTAKVVVTVKPKDAMNTTSAADDYATATGTVPVSGNVLDNDTDPEGDKQTVTPQTITDARGTLVLNADGTYTFTAKPGFAGTIDYVYKVCDDGDPSECAKATLHIQVSKGPDYTPLIFMDQTMFTNTDTTHDFVVGIYNVNNMINKGGVKFIIRGATPSKVISYDPSATTVDYDGGFEVDNKLWDVEVDEDDFILTLKPGTTIQANGISYLGFRVTVPSSTKSLSQNLTATIVYGSGGDQNNANNIYTIQITKR